MSTPGKSTKQYVRPELRAIRDPSAMGVCASGQDGTPSNCTNGSGNQFECTSGYGVLGAGCNVGGQIA